MHPDTATGLQDILEKALVHFCQCRLDRNGSQDHTDDYVGPDPEASVEDAWVVALASAMEHQQEEKESLERKLAKERKELKKVEDFDERKAMSIVLSQRHAAEKISLKERQNAALKEFLTGYPKHPDLDAWLEAQAQSPSAKSEVGIEGGTDIAPVPADIRGFQAELLQGAVRFTQAAGKGSFTDFGKKITIDKWKDRNATLAALQLATEKWAGVTVFGPKKYLKMCAELAVEHGFEIDNPEVQKMVQGLRERQEKNGKPPRPNF
jgi:hypothetical protein